MQIRVKWFLLVTFFLATLILSCGGSGENDAPSNLVSATIKPGQFSVSQAANIKGSQRTSAVSFDLGQLKATQSFYFLLSNSEGMPITDITLSVDN